MTTDGSVFIIAEAGVNHNGSRELALKLIDAAADAAADAIKFQTFRAEQLVSKSAPKALYQQRTTASNESQLDMLRGLELATNDFELLAAHASHRGIAFLSTPFDSDSLQLLIAQFRMRTIKISSGDLTNAPFLLEISRKASNVILSTGMSTLAEVEEALGVLAFGFAADPQERPSRVAFERAFSSKDGQQALRARVTILHCTTEYPAPFAEVNLRAMDALSAAFGLPVGYSDHTPGIHVAIAAVARGARIIEKHFTLDRTLPGPDHDASLEPPELTAMVSAIRDVEAALGDGVKRPTASEWKNRDAARKSIVARRRLRAGEPFDVICKRPGTGLSPFEYWNIVERRTTRDFAEDEPIDV